MSGNEPVTAAPPVVASFSGGGLQQHILDIVTCEFALVVATQKIAIPLTGREAQIPMAFLIHSGVIAYFLFRGWILVSGMRMLLFMIFAAIVAFAHLSFAATNGFSVPSMALMLATSAMLIFVVPLEQPTYRRLLDRFVMLAAIAAALVALDWGLQAAGLPIPDLETLIPQSLIYYEYVYIQPLEWGSPWMKPNGLFFLETSHVSQFIAMGLVVEIALFGRKGLIVFLASALLATLGVTGMLLAASSLPFLLFRRKVFVWVVAAIPVVLLLGVQTSLLDSLAARTDEFSRGSSSGYNRFILPLEWSATAISGPPETAWLGTGAGSMPKAINDEATGAIGLAWPPYTKVGVEYGALALVAWLAFILSSMFGRTIPLAASWAAFAQYAFLNGSNVPIHTVYCILLGAGYLVGGRPAASMMFKRARSSIFRCASRFPKPLPHFSAPCVRKNEL
jgi:hypothetical protein